MIKMMPDITKAQEPHIQLEQPLLIVVESRKEVPLPGLALVYLGRRDADRNVYPHVDFTDEGAAAYGVSRQHARVHQSKSGTYIEDLHSTNGTFINGQRLIPSRLYPVDHGDMVHLAQLRLAVTFK